MGYKKNQYQKNTNLKSEASFPQHPPVIRVKTDGRIGSVSSPASLKGGLTVDNNKKVQSHGGGLGGAAAKHMSPGHKGEAWSPRVAKARAALNKGPARAFAHPVNHRVGNLKRIKPD